MGANTIDLSSMRHRVHENASVKIVMRLIGYYNSLLELTLYTQILMAGIVHILGAVFVGVLSFLAVVNILSMHASGTQSGVLLPRSEINV
jgi:hypothetical protein